MITIGISRDRNYSSDHLAAESRKERELEAYRSGSAKCAAEMGIGFAMPTAEQSAAMHAAGIAAVSQIPADVTPVVSDSVAAMIAAANAEIESGAFMGKF
jgi:hypothetical protein